MKKPSLKTALRIGVIVAGFLTLANCTASEPTTFYTLSESVPNVEVPRSEPLRLGIGPIHLPAYLDRPQLVTRSSATRMNVADFDQWAEPLDGLVLRTLAKNLSSSLATERVLTLPARRDLPMDYQVEIDVTRFDADATGDVVLDASWRIFDSESGQLLDHGHSISRRQAVLADNYEAIALAMSHCLGLMSAEIAEALTEAG